MRKLILTLRPLEGEGSALAGELRAVSRDTARRRVNKRR